MIALLLIATSSRRCSKVSQCPSHMKVCGNEERLDITVCGAKKVKIMKQKPEQNFCKTPPYPKLPRWDDRDQPHKPKQPFTPHPYWQENGGEIGVTGSYDTRGEAKVMVNIGITW